MIRSFNPGLDRLGPTRGGLAHQPFLKVNYRGSRMRPLTKANKARIEIYKARMEKLFTVERLSDHQKLLRLKQTASRMSRKPQITMPKFNLPQEAEQNAD